MSDKAHHLQITKEDAAGNGGLGRYFLIPGSPSRAKMIAELFDEQDRAIITPRHNDTYLGRVRGDDGSSIDVAATSSGMGVGSTEIIAMELIQAGARRLIRVGTSGAVAYDRVKVGSYIIATGAVRDEMASRHYAVVEYPAVAHPDTVLALERAAFALGLQDRTFKGVIHTKASLYARAVFLGPMSEENQAYKAHLIKAGVLSSEMEAATLFVVGNTMSELQSIAEERSGTPGAIKTGTVLGIIGGKDDWAGDEEIAEIERRTCELGIAGIKQLHLIDQLAAQPA